MKETIRVLYAEDNPQDADLTRSHFAECAPEFEIEIADTGRTFLERLPDGEFDLLLLDRRLPDIDGLDVLKALRHEGCQMPVVMVTGTGDEELVVKALRLGAANYVPKSVDYLETLPDLLRDVIEEYRQKQGQGAPIAAGQRNILYVEHDPMDIDLTLRHFSETTPNFSVEVVHTCAEALSRLAQPHAYDVALIDLRMPDQNGLDFVREAKRRRLTLPPFIIISGQGDDAAAIATLKLGAADYIVKREGYLNQLTYCIERVVAYEKLNHLNLQLQFRNAVLTTQQETSPDGILIVDYDGHIVTYNQRFLDMMAVSPDVLRAGDDEPLLEAVVQKMADPTTFRARVRYLYEHPEEQSHEEIALVDGRTFDRHSATMFGADGKNYGRVWYFRDVTEQLSLQRQLSQAQKMESIGRLAGGVAHDFNNILQAIVGYSGMLLDRLPEHDETHEFAEQIAQGADRAAALTYQLLAFSRCQVLKMEDLEFNDVVNTMVRMIQRIIGENIQVEVIEARSGTVRADRGQLEQMLLNLCINARDAMPEGGVLTIRTENVVMDDEYCEAHVWALPGRYVLLSVTDTGCGMDALTQARIFEPFFTTKEAGQGTGLGLSSVYGIVRQHQGMIQVYSEVGKGTTFRVYLPSVEDIHHSRAIDAVECARCGSETILVAEDDETLRRLAMRILRNAGYTVLLAANGEEALDVFEHHKADVDLCLLDVIMPKMGGKAVYDALRQQHPGLRFLFSSGYSMDAIHTGFTLHDGIELIQKPYAPASLLRKIREILNKSPEKGSSQ